MVTRAFLRVLSLLLVQSLFLTHAQAISIGEAVNIDASSGLSARVVQEHPIGACLGTPPPIPWEVALNCIGGPFFVVETMDAAGSFYHVSAQATEDFGGGYSGFTLHKLDHAGVESSVLKFIEAICVPQGACNIPRYYNFLGWSYDVTNGRLLLAIRATASDDSLGVLEVTGFPKLFDTLLTFTPSQQTLNILTPAMPDGFRSADSLQVWTGDVRTMPDWSQARPLACTAASSPVPGQVVTVPDGLPDPAVGHGRYYLVASQSGPNRRLGRQDVNGVSSARQPASLPGCQ